MIRVVILLLLILVSIVDAKSVGKTGATFLKIGIGAKPISMGEAFCAVADDLSTIYWNPAGLALFENSEFYFTHISWFEKINYEYLAYLNSLQGLGIKFPGVVAASIAYLGVNDIKEYGNTKDSYLGTFKAYDLLLNLSYAQLINPKIGNFGINLKFINQKIKYSSSSALAFDFGWLYKTSIKNLNIAATIQNIAFFNNFKDELPFNIKLGTSYKLLKDNTLTLSLDINLPNDNDLRMHLGAEYIYPDIVEDIELSFRLGCKTGVDNGKIGFGFGITYDRYKFDYAYSSYNDLGDIHQLSFNMKFDKIMPQLLTTVSQSKGEDSKHILSHSTSSGSKSNIDFEPGEEEIIEFETTTQEPEKTESTEPIQDDLEEISAAEEKPIIDESDEEDKLSEIRKKIEEEMRMMINEQESKAKALQEALNYLKTELEEKDLSSKAKVSIGGKR